MRVLGVAADGSTSFDEALGHGATPELTAWDAGFTILQPLSADRNDDGELTLRVLVTARGSTPRPEQPVRGRDIGLVLRPGEVPQVRQRIAAYAVVRSSRGLLATRYSARTSADGRWGMPGGGIDATETPRAAVLREVGEETAQTIDLGELIMVQTGHWIGRSPRARVEDFHAVRLVYEATCPDPADPVVLDADGTTSAARWVDLADWRQLPWTHGWQQILGELLDRT